jgi:Ca2+-binding RTX toxin-like protein
MLIGGSGPDLFFFQRSQKSGNTDTIQDFKDNTDRLGLIWSLGVRTVQEALDHAEVIKGDTVFTFSNGNVVILEGIADKSLLRNDIDIMP